MKTLILLALCLLPAIATAAEDRQGPPIYTKLNAKVGAWAEYSYERKKGSEVTTKGKFRMAVVGKEGDAIWLEQKVTGEIPAPKKDRGPMLMKMLIGKEKVEKAYMKTDKGVMEMSGMMGFSAKKPHEASEKAKLKDVGTESVSVPAGSFKATHYVFEEKDKGDAWVKAGVGPYGLIKQVIKGEKTTEVLLLAHGTDAKSEVDHASAKSMSAEMMSRKGRKGGKMPEGMENVPAGQRPDMGDLFKKMMKKKAGLE